MQIGILHESHTPDEQRPAVGEFAQQFERLMDGNGFDFATYSIVDIQFPAYITDCTLNGKRLA